MSDPLFSLGARRTAEMLTEILVPLTLAGTGWWAAQRYLSEPSVTRELAPVELLVILGALATLFAWYTVRQLTLVNTRRPWVHALWALISVAGAIGTLSFMVAWSFESKCVEMGGATVETAALLGEVATVCQMGGVPDNAYLPGTLLRPTWSGHLSIPHLVLLGLLAPTAGLGLRNFRLRPTRMGMALVDQLQMAPAAGPTGVMGASGADSVQACGNPTLWGEPCGQLYAIDREFEPGEWCVRCSQVYQKTERTLQFTVVSLFTSEIDILNGLERLDALSWAQGDPVPPDARLSGQERWVRLGRIEVPDVISIATLLQFVQARLKGWQSKASEDALPAFELAARRSSRLSAWIWLGHHDHRLTYARPTERALLGIGATRLRDLALDVGEELVLQLDIGLLPLELRTGFRQTFLDPDRAPVVQNIKQDFWVPITALRPRDDGLWVPRIEGAALRTWLSLDRLRPEDVRGVSSPRAYLPVGAEPTDTAGERYDLVRMPLDGNEPTMERVPADSIAEWDWMERRLIELIRQQPLVMVEA